MAVRTDRWEPVRHLEAARVQRLEGDRAGVWGGVLEVGERPLLCAAAAL